MGRYDELGSYLSQDGLLVLDTIMVNVTMYMSSCGGYFVCKPLHTPMLVYMCVIHSAVKD